MKVHHIGIVVKDIAKSVFLYTQMGYEKTSEIIVDNIQNNAVVFMQNNSSPRLELVSPLNENSSIYRFAEGYHHICYETESGEDVLQRFREMHIGKVFTKPIVAPALNGRKVVFACLRNKTFIEFIL